MIKKIYYFSLLFLPIVSYFYLNVHIRTSWYIFYFIPVVITSLFLSELVRLISRNVTNNIFMSYQYGLMIYITIYCLYWLMVLPVRLCLDNNFCENLSRIIVVFVYLLFLFLLKTQKNTKQLK